MAPQEAAWKSELLVTALVAWQSSSLSARPSSSESAEQTRSVVLVQACVSTLPASQDEAQLAQVLWPVLLAKDPAGQATGCALPPAQEEPAGHSSMATATCTPLTLLKVR